MAAGRAERPDCNCMQGFVTPYNGVRTGLFSSWAGGFRMESRLALVLFEEMPGYWTLLVEDFV